MIMQTYFEQKKLKIIHEQVENVINWFWTNDDIHGWELMKYDWEEHHSKKWFQYVKKFDVVLQAGGSCGMYPRLLANRFKRVFTFEPDPLSFHCLVNNCQFDRIVKMNAALGYERGLMGWTRGDINVGMSKLDPTQHILPLPVIRIDDLNLKTLDLLALDVEGYEIEAIRGALKTIERCHPVIVLESTPAEINTTIQLMKIWGYNFIGWSGSDTIFN